MRASSSRLLKRPLLALLPIFVVLASLLATAPAQAVDHSISGTVTATTGGAPLEGVSVSLYKFFDEGGGNGFYDWVDATETGPGGTYSFLEPAGLYRVQFYGGADYITEWYLNASTLESATDVDITTTAKAGINGTLASAGHITGSVPEFSAAGGWVNAYAFDGSFYNYVSGAYVEPGQTDYSIGGLATGSYFLQFGVDSGNYLSEYYNNKATVETADAVAVTAPSTVTSINASLSPAAHITGTVPQFAGAGGDVNVYAETSPGLWDWVSSGYVDQGQTTYDVGNLPAGSYKVQFYPYDDHLKMEYYNDKPDLDSADIIPVGAGGTVSGVDATLAEYGRITGHVSNSASAALPDVRVIAYTLQDVDGTPTWLPSNDTWTDESGNYDFPLNDGSYRLKFDADDGYYAPEFYNNVATVGSATSLTVTSGVVNANRNAVLTKGAVISGTVTMPALAGTSADARGADHSVSIYNVSTGKVAAQGSFDLVAGTRTYKYKLGGLAAGTYRVEFARASGPSYRASGPSTVEGRYYNGKLESGGSAAATPVAVAAGQTKTGIDASLRLGGTITGYVLDATGHPLAGCQVAAYSRDGKYATHSTAAGSDGGFRLTGLSTGSYRIAVLNGFNSTGGGVCDTEDEFYVGGEGALSPDEGDSVTVAAKVGQDVQLPTPMFYGTNVAPSLTSISKSTSPSVSGTFAVGKTLTANPGTWSPAATKVRYQWLRNGVPIAGLVSSKYTLVASDKGDKIQVRVTAIAAGKAPKTVLTAAKTVAAGTLVVSGSNTIIGTLKVGYTLKTPYTVPSGATATYQWYRSGVAITGATHSYYKLTSASKGKKISLKVVFKKPGYTTLTKTATKAGTVT